jgi:hypothetical protein
MHMMAYYRAVKQLGIGFFPDCFYDWFPDCLNGVMPEDA